LSIYQWQEQSNVSDLFYNSLSFCRVHEANTFLFLFSIIVFPIDAQFGKINRKNISLRITVVFCLVKTKKSFKELIWKYGI